MLHTSYCPQASGVVECSNGRIKRHADVSHHKWDARLSQAVLIATNHWGNYGKQKIQVFHPTGPLMGNSPIPDDQRGQFPLRTHVGYLYGETASVGIVPMTLAKSSAVLTQACMPGKP